MQQTEKRVSAHIMENNNFCGGAQQRCIKLDWLNFLSLSSHGNPKLTEEFLTNSRILFLPLFGWHKKSRLDLMKFYHSQRESSFQEFTPHRFLLE